MEENSFYVTNHSDGSDLIKTKDDTSLSDAIRDTSKVGEILSKFSPTEPLAQQYARPNIQYHKLYENNQGEFLFLVLTKAQLGFGMCLFLPNIVVCCFTPTITVGL